MADIELVIKIPDHYYENNIKKELPVILSEDNIIAILPKGHGRLIDADELNKCIVDRITMPYVPINKIQDAPTIIEADKERE